jgi:hypothetical protein
MKRINITLLNSSPKSASAPLKMGWWMSSHGS